MASEQKISDQFNFYIPEVKETNFAVPVSSQSPADGETNDLSNTEEPNTVLPPKEFPPPYAGMGKEMVLYYSNTPGFNRARKALLIIFWGSWLVLLGAVIYLTVTHEKCKLKKTIEWYHNASIYQIYPRSFMDSNGDGIGDLKGIEDKLSYLRELNVDGVWISPFYNSSMRDLGYDVIDYKVVDTDYGSMADFDSLVKEMHKKVDGKDLKLIIDFIPNHTSSESEWFLLSVNREKPYDEYYIWRDCVNNGTHVITPPNNWQSVMRGVPAWTYHPGRGQCYLHQYQSSMPDLNLRNNRVKQELDDVLRFWLDKEVDGIRIDAISKLYEDYALGNETVADSTKDAKDYYSGYLNHNKTCNLPEVMDMVNRWRGIIDEYSNKNLSGTVRPRLMIAQARGTPEELEMYYGRTKQGGAHFPFNFELSKTISDESCDGVCVATAVDSWMNNLPKEAIANWQLGSHDKARIATKVGTDRLDAHNMLLLTLPGVAVAYYGDELGMTNINISNASYISRDPVGFNNKSQSRDPQRSPMQWDADPAACYGFTSNCSGVWLPMHPDASTINVAVEREDHQSHLIVFKNLSRLRTEETFTYGDWTEHKVTSNIYSFLRTFDGLNSYLVVVNLGDTSVKDYDITDKLPVSSATVAAITGKSSYTIGDKVELNKVNLEPGEGVILTWPYIIKQLI